MKNLKIIEARINGQVFPISPAHTGVDSGNHISVIIGNNATGKSRLLTSMLNCLRQGANPRLRSNTDNAELTLYVNDEFINIDKDNAGIAQDINLISISNSLFDKFPHEAKSDVNYSYIGVRPTGIGSHRKAITNDLMDVLSSYLSDINFRRKTKELFSLLGLSSVMDVSLKSMHTPSKKGITELLWNNASTESLSSYLEKISTQGFYRQQRNRINGHLADLSFMEGFHNYLRRDFNDFMREGRKSLRYKINLEAANENNEFIEEYKYFTLLRQLNLLTYESILVHKAGKSYDINDSSTGEIGLLTTFIRAVPHLKPNSIIFIDEPEISLHPSWQMKYIDLLQMFLDGFNNCHVIIATHSHLILSDLRKEWSSILTLRLGDNYDVIAELKSYTPFGWAPEAILYEVFGVATVRNQLFERELSDMLNLIAIESDDIELIKGYIDKFESFDYSEADPLNLVIEEAKEYVANR